MKAELAFRWRRRDWRLALDAAPGAARPVCLLIDFDQAGERRSSSFPRDCGELVQACADLTQFMRGPLEGWPAQAVDLVDGLKGGGASRAGALFQIVSALASVNWERRASHGAT